MNFTGIRNTREQGKHLVCVVRVLSQKTGMHASVEAGSLPSVVSWG